MNWIKLESVEIHQLQHELWAAHGVELWVLRLDLIHPLIQGNKWFKLKYNLEAALAQGYRRLLTFGGAYSNHILASSAAARAYNLELIGVIRGEVPQILSPVLKQALELGMQIEFIDRDRYRHKHEPQVICELQKRWGDFYLIPEGGANVLGLQGVYELVKTLPYFPIHALACGTGNTLAGLVAALTDKTQILGFPVIKGGEYLNSDIESYLSAFYNQFQHCFQPSPSLWQLETVYHCGGYAKKTADLLAFIESFSLATGLPLEPVYTGKLFYGLQDLLVKGRFTAGTRVLAWHTGGLSMLNQNDNFRHVNN